MTTQPYVVIANADWSRAIAAFHDLSVAANETAVRMRKLTMRLFPSLSAAADSLVDDVWVCGLEARFYIRGGHSQDVDSLVRSLLHDPISQAGQGERFLFSRLTPAQRGRLAAAALRGHVEGVR